MAGDRRSRPKPPAHLSVETAAWWRKTLQEYELESHHLRLLQCSREAWDRMQQARRDLDEHGSLNFVTAGGTIRAHPSVGIERDSRTGFARMIGELGLDVDEPAAPTRPVPSCAHGESDIAAPTKRKSDADEEVELKAWRMTFKTGFDYLRDLPKTGIPLGKRHTPPRELVEDAWRRLGPAYLKTLPPDLPTPPWALREFGSPEADQRKVLVRRHRR